MLLLTVYKCLFLSVFISFVRSEPVTLLVGAGVVSAGLSALYGKFSCSYYECCEDPYVRAQVPSLESELRKSLFGQHLVYYAVSRSVENHVSKKNPKKALVMSFHGWTGVGKNFASQIIVKSLYQKGMESEFVHLYVGPRDFPYHDEVQTYQKRIKSDIEKSTQKCERSFFIFDEIDKMPAGVLDALTPYLDFHEQINGINYRRNIFIFLSNSAGDGLIGVAMKFWKDGKAREQISLKDVERVIATRSFNEIGGLSQSEVVKKDLIDVYVPFLPLEKKHVIMCVMYELRERGLEYKLQDSKFAERIANELIYQPDELELYSSSGCKKISNKVDIHIS